MAAAVARVGVVAGAVAGTYHVPTIDQWGNVVFDQILDYDEIEIDKPDAIIIIKASMRATTVTIDAQIVVVFGTKIQAEQLHITATRVYLLNDARFRVKSLVCRARIQRGDALGRGDQALLKIIGITLC